MLADDWELDDDDAPDAPPGAASTPFVRGDHIELGQRLIRCLRAQAPAVFADGNFYQYNERTGVFDVIDRSHSSKIVQGFAGAKVAGSKKPLSLRATDVYGAIKMGADQAADVEFFANAKPGIAFVDCFVEVSTRGIVRHEHSADHRARFAYPFGFQPEARPERWLAFLGQVFRDDADAEQKIAVVQEYLGASLLGRATKYQRALVLLGEGSNGKGVLSTIAERSMPPGSVCAVAPQELGQEYRRAMLAGKLLNIVSELPEQDILDSEAFKAVVAGDTITGRPIREAPFTFRPRSGHMYSANRLPGTADQTHGFWRRLVVVGFNRIFTEEERDPYLADKLTAEVPQIVSWLLASAQRLAAAGRYTTPESSVAATEGWQRQADQVRAFVDERTELLPLDAKPSEWIRADQLYRSFKEWAVDNGHRPVASNKFGERMKLLGLASKHTEHGRVYPVRERPRWPS